METLGFIAAAAVVVLLAGFGLVKWLVGKTDTAARAETERDVLMRDHERERRAEVPLDQPIPIGHRLLDIVRLRRERRMREQIDN